MPITHSPETGDFVGGIRFENKSMKTDAGVKNYYMKIVRGGEELQGIFTGDVVTKVDMSLITVPIQATYDVCDNLRFKLGPYVSYVTSKKFEGWAYNGYLRRQEEGHPKGDPTGQKVMLGEKEGERGDYDFSDDMRNWHVGVDFGIDWKLEQPLGHLRRPELGPERHLQEGFRDHRADDVSYLRQRRHHVSAEVTDHIL